MTFIKFIYILALIFFVGFGLTCGYFFFKMLGPMFFIQIPIEQTPRVMIVWFLSGIGLGISILGAATFWEAIA